MRDANPMSTEPSDPRERAEAVKARLERELLALPGVRGVATGPETLEGRPTGGWAIRLYVDPTSAVAPDEALPRELDGVRVEVVERRFVPHGGAAEPSEEGRD